MVGRLRSATRFSAFQTDRQRMVTYLRRCCGSAAWLELASTRDNLLGRGWRLWGGQGEGGRGGGRAGAGAGACLVRRSHQTHLLSVLAAYASGECANESWRVVLLQLEGRTDGKDREFRTRTGMQEAIGHVRPRFDSDFLALQRMQLIDQGATAHGETRVSHT